MLGWEECAAAIDRFFTVHPPPAWKARSNDVPLKAIKTTLSHLCKSLGTELLHVIDAVSKPPTGATVPIVRQYAQLMLNKAAEGDSSARAAPDAADAASTAQSLPSATVPASSTTGSTQNADPNNNNEYMARLLAVRSRYGIESVPVTYTPAEAAIDSAAAEKKIEELRARMRAVRASYEPPAADGVSGSTPAVTVASHAPKSAAAPVASPAAPAQSAAQSLAAIRERLAKLK